MHALLCSTNCAHANHRKQTSTCKRTPEDAHARTHRPLQGVRSLRACCNTGETAAGLFLLRFCGFGQEFINACAHFEAFQEARGMLPHRRRAGPVCCRRILWVSISTDLKYDAGRDETRSHPAARCAVCSCLWRTINTAERDLADVAGDTEIPVYPKGTTSLPNSKLNYDGIVFITCVPILFRFRCGPDAALTPPS